MEVKIINVYYGQDLLPYKDVERQVHYPITSGAFLGASNTTKIRFYFDRIGDTAATYVSVAKLPNGKQGSQVLSKSSDDDGNYAELELSNWYTQAKGDVYIALQGYSGGVEYSYDSETELYEIHGTPIIQTTGSIKLAINYAPIGDSADYNDEFTTYQEILAGLGDKVDKKETSGLHAYTHDGSVQGEIGVSKLSVADYIVQRDGQQIAVPLTPSANDNATSKKYVDDSIASAISSVYKYKGSVATYSDLPSSGLTIGDVYNVEETGDNYAWTGTTWDKLAGDIDLSDYATKDYVDTGLSGKQNTLVNQVNIKSINNQSLLGTGNIDIQGGSGGGTWGTITGDIQDQTDLQNELSDIREVAEGKCKTWVLSYLTTAPTTNSQAQALSKPDGTHFTNLADFTSYVSELSLKNSSFNTQDNYVDISGTFDYLITYDNVVYKVIDLIQTAHAGDVILVAELNVPDRWFTRIGTGGAELQKLETSKIDLTNYATKTNLATAVAEINSNFAGLYNNTNTYTIGEIVVHDNKLYRCTTAITTAEDWDSTHWEQITVANGFVNLTGTQVISGNKGFDDLHITYRDNDRTNSIKFNGHYSTPEIYVDLYDLVANVPIKVAGELYPLTSALFDLGKSDAKWKDLYLSGKLYSTQYINLGSAGDYAMAFYYNASPLFQVGTSSATTFQNFLPNADNSKDIGSSSLSFKDGYFAGQVYAQNTFNVINASDISNNTLTQAQYDLITNGKPTLIKGTLDLSGNTFIDPVIFSWLEYSTSWRAILLAENKITSIILNTSSKTLSHGGGDIRLKCANINDKNLPSYPANTGTYNYQCVNGTLAWNEQWYGTQAQYDALGTYDSNTTYNIIED